ncbi:hypothetical protein K7432_008934 [Basidiobolus ranarum]|uniref:Uncharacterized protein n=1 Tax=Basidiobolus ranarum TaxID=34480 RepID=A0ABR2WR30_9FUNG
MDSTLLNLRVNERPSNSQLSGGDNELNDTPNNEFGTRDSGVTSNASHQLSSIAHDVNIVDNGHNKMENLTLIQDGVQQTSNGGTNSSSLARANNFSPFWTTENIARLLKYLETHFEDYNNLKKNEFYRQAAASLGFTWQQVKNKLERLKKEYVNSRLAQIAQQSASLNGSHSASVHSRPNLQFYDRLDILFGHEVGLNGSNDGFGQSFFGTPLMDDLDSDPENSPMSGMGGESPLILNMSKRRRTAESLDVDREQSHEPTPLVNTASANMYPISGNNFNLKRRPDERSASEKRKFALEEERLKLEKRKLDWEEDRLKLDKRKIDWEEQCLQLEKRKIEWELESARRRFELEKETQIEDLRRKYGQ